MRKQTVFSPACFGVLLLCFAVGAAAAYWLGDTLPSVRILWMPAEPWNRLGKTAAECAVWLAVSLTVCAVPVSGGLALLRGGCFGGVLAMLQSPKEPVLPLVCYAAVSVILLVFISTIPGTHTLRARLTRFLPCAGLAFAAVLMVG